jgi:hypothetical protein
MSTSVASSVSECLLSASDDSLSSALALIQELSLFSLMWSKGAEFFEKVNNKINRGTWSANSNHFHEKVVAKGKEFAGLSRGERLLKAIGELQQLMGVPPRDLRTSFDLAEAADDIGMGAVKILREDKEAKFSGNDVGGMIEFQITKIFGGLNITMAELSASEQKSLVDRVREFLQSLPSDQQRFIMEKLGAADLSESAIRQAIASGTMWTAFAAAVQVFGFAFYTTAAQLLAIVSLHLLPFGAYVGLCSTIAVLSSAWMLPIFAGLGIWYYGRKNRGLRLSMGPLIVTSLCLSGMDVQARPPMQPETAGEEALSLWRDARTVRDQKRAVSANARSVRDQAQVRLSATRNELAQAVARKAKSACERDSLDRQLAPEVIRAASAIAGGQWGSSLTTAAARILEIKQQIGNARQKRDQQTGFWKSLTGSAEHLLDSWSLNSQLSSANDALVQEVKSTWPKEGSKYSPNATSVLWKMEEKTSEILAADTDINRLTTQERAHSKQLDQASTELRSAESEQTASERRYFGLGTV